MAKSRRAGKKKSTKKVAGKQGASRGTQKTASVKASRKKKTAHKTVRKKAPSKKTAKKAVAKKTTKKTVAKKAAPKKAAKKAAPKKAAKRAAPKKASTKKAAKKAPAKKSTAGRAAATATSKKAANKRTGSKKTPSKASTKKTAAKKTAQSASRSAQQNAASKRTSIRVAAAKKAPAKASGTRAPGAKATPLSPVRRTEEAEGRTPRTRGISGPGPSDVSTSERRPVRSTATPSSASRAELGPNHPAGGAPVAAHPDAGLSAAQVQELHEKLVEERARKVAELERHMQEALGEPNVMPDETDMAQRSTEQAYLIRFADKERKLLNEIDRALEKLRTGDYGVCEGTEEPIGFKRLELRPWTRYSVAYKEQIERERSQHRR